MFLAMVDFTPMVGAVLIAWVLSVCVHEFSHAYVAYLGGDRTEQNRDNLSNPLNYIDPVYSILLPVLFVALGGIPLMGGSVLIRIDLLRSKMWQSAVSAAGPASTFLLFLILAAILHPATGIVDPTAAVQPNWVQLVGTMTVLLLLAGIFNMLPIPGFDGFGIIEPWLNPETQYKARMFSRNAIFILYALLIFTETPWQILGGLIALILYTLGLPPEVTWDMYSDVLFGNA